jgi:hypothetical protein
MRSFFKVSTIFFLIWTLVGCGESTSSSSSDLTIVTKKSEINNLQDELTLSFSVKNNYTSGVDVNLSELSIDVAPCTVEEASFNPSEVLLDDSVREMTVTAFVKFDTSCTPTSYALHGMSTLSLDGKVNEVTFNSAIIETTPEESLTITAPVSTDENESSETATDTINYAIDFSLESDIKLDLEEKKSFHIALIDPDKNLLIPSSQIQKMVITSLQANVAKIFDTSLYSTPTDEITYTEENDKTLYIQTSTQSGLASIKIEVEYLNTKGTVETVSKVYALTVLSGPPTTFSINDDGVSYNSTEKWFEHKYLISATDKYNNLVNISPTIYINAMTDFTKDSTGKPIIYGKFGTLKGSLIADKENKKASLEVNSSIFDNIDYDRDYAIVFGDIHSYEALGKWDINSGLSSDTALFFTDTYNGETHDGLGFAVGHNYIEEICDSSYREWHLKIDSTDGTYTLDSEGKTTVTVKYPAEYLYGKLGALSVNFLGKNPETDEILRSGEVYFDVWNNVEGLYGESYKISKGTGEQNIRHYGIINTGTGDKFVLKNSSFSCKVDVQNAEIISSVRKNSIITDSSECDVNIGEASYIEYTVRALDDVDGTITFSDCYVNGIPNF